MFNKPQQLHLTDVWQTPHAYTQPTANNRNTHVIPLQTHCDYPRTVSPPRQSSLRPKPPSVAEPSASSTPEPNTHHWQHSGTRASQTGQIFPEFLLVSCNLLKCRNSRVQNPKPHNRQGSSIFESPDYLSSTWASHQTISHLCGQVATMGQMVKSPCLLWKWGKW